MSSSNEVTAKVTFSMLRGKVGDRLLDAIESMGFTEPTEIQAKTLPHLLLGKDLIGSAKTGSGKTLAFLIPTIELLDKLNFAPVHGTGCIILSPTRELVLRTYTLLEKMSQFVPLSCARANKGTNKKLEAQRLEQGKNIIVATPGRLLSHMKNSRNFKFSNLKMLVISADDKIESAGFDSDIKRIIELLPKERQTVIFCATVTKKLHDLANLVMSSDRIYVTIDSNEISSTNSTLTQGISPHTMTTMGMEGQGYTFNGAMCMKEQHISTYTFTDEKYISTYPKVQPASLEAKLPNESHKSCVNIQQSKEQQCYQPQDMVKMQSEKSKNFPLPHSSLSKNICNKPSTSVVCQLESERSQLLFQNKPNLIENCINVAKACDNMTELLADQAQLIIEATNKVKPISNQTTLSRRMYNEPPQTIHPKQQPINQCNNFIQEKQSNYTAKACDNMTELLAEQAQFIIEATNKVKPIGNQTTLSRRMYNKPPQTIQSKQQPINQCDNFIQEKQSNYTAKACDNMTELLAEQAQFIIEATNKVKPIGNQTTLSRRMYNEPPQTIQSKQQPINQCNNFKQEKQNKDFCALALNTVNTGATISSVNLSQVAISQVRETIQKSSAKGTIFQENTPNMKRSHADVTSSPRKDFKRARIESGESSAPVDQQKSNAIGVVVMTEPLIDLSARRAEKIIERISEEYVKWTLQATDAKAIVFQGQAYHSVKDEAVKLRCANEETVDWLKKTVESLAPLWPGCKLVTKKCSELTKYVKCGLLAPKWKYSIDRLHKFLAGINPHLKVNEWVLYDYNETDNGIFLVLGIPETTVLNEVVPNGRLVHYILGSIYLKFFTPKGKLVNSYPAIDSV